MIRLEVKDYCHDCVDFEADVEGPTKLYSVDDIVAWTDTIVRCKHRNRCANIVKYVVEEYKEKENA